MASNDFANGKIHGATEAKSKFGHTTKDERLRRNHTNKHIDKSRTHLNASIHEMLTGHEYTYDEICAHYDARIIELDKVPRQSKRKDRVTLQAIETPAPKDLPEDKMDAWFLRVAQIEMEIFGEENFLDGHIDKDETHEYIHPVTKEKVTSRNHMVAYLFPVVRDKDGNEKLNCKQFSRRANINKLNKMVEEMSVKEFGVNFMTGEKTKSGKTVEQLKRDSEIAELELRELQATETASEIVQEREALAFETRIEHEAERVAELQAQASDAEAIIADAQRQASRRAQAILEDANEQVEDAITAAGQIQAEAMMEARMLRQQAYVEAMQDVADNYIAYEARSRDFQAKEDALEAQKAAVAETKRQFTEAARRYEQAEPTIENIPMRDAIPVIVAGIAEYFASAANDALSTLGRTLQAWMGKKNYKGSPLMDVLIEKLTSGKKRPRPSIVDLPQAQRSLDDEMGLG